MPSEKPSYEELLQRIEALEEAKIQVSDLPLAELIRKIEMLGVDSSAVNGLDLGAKVRLGKVSMFFNGSSISDTVVLQHGLGYVPTAFVPMAHAPSGNITDAVVVNYVANPTDLNVTIRGRTVSGAAVGPGAATIYYIVG